TMTIPSSGTGHRSRKKFRQIVIRIASDGRCDHCSEKRCPCLHLQVCSKTIVSGGGGGNNRDPCIARFWRTLRATGQRQGKITWLNGTGVAVPECSTGDPIRH